VVLARAAPAQQVAARVALVRAAPGQQVAVAVLELNQALQFCLHY
jgi:hypothetical protein